MTVLSWAVSSRNPQLAAVVPTSPQLAAAVVESESFLRLEVLFFLLPSAATWTITSDLTLGWTIYAGALEPSRSSYQRILLIGPLALVLALARRYNWSRAAL